MKWIKITFVRLVLGTVKEEEEEGMGEIRGKEEELGEVGGGREEVRGTCLLNRPKLREKTSGSPLATQSER
ncbi:hypothetical protein E2C01_037565 [Portunus trituberculatus]|uniref:Uncharacterized protein n=1 Tax=Portunus trituberculatus TaxID=210409 RepID=A0A5B7F8G5_PORTR|nr:hypothetical protein [Portunus trituberculatus]